MDFRIYSRKSVYTGKGESIENQIELCRAYIFANYPGASEHDITIYEDEGYSGKSLERPQFKQMMTDIKTEKTDCIVCYRLDRISRNVGDFANLIEQLNASNIAFVCIKEKFDTGTPMGKAMMYIASVFAQLERETIAERVRDNMLMLAKMGRWLGGTTPTGFTSEKTAEVIIDGKVKTSCKLKPNPDELSTVRLIYEKMSEYHSLNAVRKHLACQGITTRKGSTFSLPTIKDILQNPVYCTADKDSLAYFREQHAVVCFDESVCGSGRGLLSYNKRDYSKSHAPRHSMEKWVIAAGRHEGVIRGRDWVSIQRILEEIRPNRAKPSVVHNDYSLLSGMIYCTRCGSRMFAKRRYNNPNYFDYICSNKAQLNRCSCANLNGLQTDELVCQYLKGYETTDSRIHALLCSLKNETCRTYREPPSILLDKRLKEIDSEIDNLLDALSADRLEPALIRRINDRVSTLDLERDELLKQKRESASNAGDEKAVLCDMLARTLAVFKDNFEVMNIYERRALIRLIVQKCAWDGENFHIFIYGE